MYYSKFHLYIYMCIMALFVTIGIDAQNLDSLRHQIEMQTGKDKHNSLAMYFMLTKDTPEGISYLRNQLAIAEKKRDAETQGKILQLFLTNHYFLQNGDSVLFYVDKIKQVNTQHPLYFYFEVMKGSVNILIMDGRYEMALQELDEMLAEATKRDDVLAKALAYQLIAAVYNSMHQPEQAAKYVTEGLQLISPVKSAELKLYTLRFDLYNHGALAAALKEDYNEGLAYTDSMYNGVKLIEEHYIQNGRYTEDALAHYYYNTHSQRLSNLTSLGRLDEAKAVLDELTVIAGNPAIPQAYKTATFNYAQAHYLTAKGDYTNALAFLDNAMETTRTQLFSQYPLSLLLKAEILEKQRKFQPAIGIYKELYHIQDSLKRSELQKQVADLKSVYQVKELEQKAEERELRMRVAYGTIAFISLACILLVIMVIVIRRNARQQKEKNRILYIQLKEQDKYKDALRAIAAVNLPEREQGNDLYERINDFVLQNKCFLDPDINREQLALIMGTNYKYLADAVKEATGKTFSVYITDLRLEYARNLITTNPYERIQNVYNYSGFTNKTTFNRSFTKKFGLTPSDFRTMVKEMQNEPAKT